MINSENLCGDKGYQKSPTSSNGNYGNPQIIKPDAGQNLNGDYSKVFRCEINRLSSLLNSDESFGAYLILAHIFKGRVQGVSPKKLLNLRTNLNGNKKEYIKKGPLGDYREKALHLLEDDETRVGAATLLRSLKEAEKKGLDLNSLLEVLVLKTRDIPEIFAIINPNNYNGTNGKHLENNL